jgi:hypothetical protein
LRPRRQLARSARIRRRRRARSEALLVGHARVALMTRRALRPRRQLGRLARSDLRRSPRSCARELARLAMNLRGTPIICRSSGLWRQLDRRVRSCLRRRPRSWARQSALLMMNPRVVLMTRRGSRARRQLKRLARRRQRRRPGSWARQPVRLTRRSPCGPTICRSSRPGIGSPRRDEEIHSQCQVIIFKIPHLIHRRPTATAWCRDRLMT